jgi:tRNA (Thr-GGU) A37 N-methylase
MTLPAAIFSGKARTMGLREIHFYLRSLARLDPIGTPQLLIWSHRGRDRNGAGLDCSDGTPLTDLKPDRGLFTPIAPPQPGDFQVGDP